MKNIDLNDYPQREIGVCMTSHAWQFETERQDGENTE